MATTTYHAQLIKYLANGDQYILNLKNTGDDVSISRSSNGNLPAGATTAQGLANSLGALAFRSSLGKGDVGLGNVDNTADSAKSVKYATSAGSAASATKATQDSSSQTITSTYIKSLSVSGRTITFTKGDNTTGSITTQDTNTTYSVFKAASSSAAGGTGLVPAPAAGAQAQYLRGDGKWATPTNTVYTHPTSSGNKHIPSGGSAGQILRWSSDGTAVWGSDNNTTYSTGTSSASGLTKLYGGTGSATDGTMTQSAITSALNGKLSTGGIAAASSKLMLGSKGTIFNWNGQGGQPEWVFGANEKDITGGSTSNVYVYNPSNFWVSHANKSSTLDVTFNPISSNNLDTPLNFAQHGVSANFITALNQVTDQPAQYAMLLTVGSPGSDCHQIWMNQPSGRIYHRGGNSSGWSGGWKRILCDDDIIQTAYYDANASQISDISYASIKFTGGTNWGIIKGPNSLMVANNRDIKFRFQDTCNYCDANFNSAGIYTNTSSGSPNVYISEQGNVKRSTSASKYKLDIKPLEEDASYPYKLLKLEPKQWFDKGDIERYSDLLTKEYNKEEIDEEEKLFAEDGDINPYYGLIAEDIEKAGLEKFCVYDKKNKEIEGIMYDRLPILMIPILKDLVDYVKTTYPLIKDSIKDKDSLSKVSSIIDRMNSINDSTMVNTTYKVDNTEK